MSEKKNLDRLFQEKLKDFEPVPPERVWAGIEAGLKKEDKDRRVVPLWFKLAGVAAILITGMLLTLPLFGDFDKSAIPVVLEEGNNGSGNGEGRIQPTENPVKHNQTVTDIGDETIVINTTPDRTVSGGGNRPEEKAGQANGNIGTSTGNASGKDFINTNTAVTQAPKNNRRDNNLPLHRNAAGTRSPRSFKGNDNTTVAYREDGTGRNKSARNRAGRQQGINTAADNSTVINRDTKEAYAKSSNDQKKNAADTNSNVNGNAKQNTVIDDSAVAAAPADGNLQMNEGNAIINDSIANNTLAVTDSVKVAPENELENILKEKLNEEKKKEEQLADEDKDRWNIRPQLAPIFYNSFSNGSPIDSQFAANSKDYDNALSYGVGIDYAINKRLSVRTGVNTVNLSYSTNDIQFFAALGEQTANVVSQNTTANIVVQNAVPENPEVSFADAQLSVQKFNGTMVQEMGYIEVPLEMSYKLVDSRFGINVIGGLSTLFLNENNVSVVSTQGLSSDIGEAQNLNNIHFTTNIGVGFKYRFWKSFQASFEPTFKYQLNAFSNNPGNFRPYFIGLYSGISFSF